MSHTPPVPPGNQSPFPIQEPPHAPAGPEVTVATAPVKAQADPARPAAPATTASDTSADRAGAAGGQQPAASDQSDGWAMPAAKRSWSMGRIVGAAAGVGAIAIGVAAVLFPREGKPQPGKKKRKN